MPLLISLLKMEIRGATSNSLTTILTSAMELHGGLSSLDIAMKLLYFGVDGVPTFQRKKYDAIKKLLER